MPDRKHPRRLAYRDAAELRARTTQAFGRSHPDAARARCQRSRFVRSRSCPTSELDDDAALVKASSDAGTVCLRDLVDRQVCRDDGPPALGWSLVQDVADCRVPADELRARA